ncbi:hypothetical protein [Desulfolucanica intricata]|uniref:hypothetical protein n=1 Tax=Desulfolucanica intricata TaxID=1285191 RepID=UPI00082EE2AD|nr:hypothetical protein [Desulfolucanica intricata]
MSEKQGKVIEFKPRAKRKLKDPQYVDPAKKELLKQRDREKKMKQTRQRVVKNIGLFVLVCFIVYLIKIAF